jgi:glycine/D-amino acid oxidase-like deaminating enzyme
MIDLPHDLASDNYSGSNDSDRQVIGMNRAAIAFAAEAAEELGMPAEAFAKVGKVNGASTEKGTRHLDDYARHLKGLAEPFELFDEKAMLALTGTSFYRQGLFTPGAAMAQPAMFVRAVAAGVLDAGLALYEQSPVTGLGRIDKSWCATTPKGAVTAPKVILAVNGHAESFGFFERRLMHVFTYASMSRALAEDEVRKLGGKTRWGILPADPMGTTVRRIDGTGGHRIVIRNRFTYDPSMTVDDRRLSTMAVSHDRSFDARFPSLKGIDMAYRWGGRLCLSRNNVPAFGEIEDNLFSACCQNGLGTTKGTLAGLLAAELAVNTNNPMLESMLAHEQPSRLPPEPMAWIGANAVMRWKEWRAGNEL